MGTRSPKRSGNFWGRNGPLWSNGTLYGALCKNGRTDRYAVLDEDSGVPTESCIRWGADAQGEGAIFGGCSGHSKALTIFAAAVAALQCRCKRDHSVANNHAVEGIIQYARQAQIVFWKFLGAGNADYRPRKGWWDCTALSKSDIYHCLVYTLVSRRMWPPVPECTISSIFRASLVFARSALVLGHLLSLSVSLASHYTTDREPGEPWAAANEPFSPSRHRQAGRHPAVFVVRRHGQQDRKWRRCEKWNTPHSHIEHTSAHCCRRWNVTQPRLQTTDVEP